MKEGTRICFVVVVSVFFILVAPNVKCARANRPRVRHSVFVLFLMNVIINKR